MPPSHRTSGGGSSSARFRYREGSRGELDDPARIDGVVDQSGEGVPALPVPRRHVDRRSGGYSRSSDRRSRSEARLDVLPADGAMPFVVEGPGDTVGSDEQESPLDVP